MLKRKPKGNPPKRLARIQMRTRPAMTIGMNSLFPWCQMFRRLQQQPRQRQRQRPPRLPAVHRNNSLVTTNKTRRRHLPRKPFRRRRQLRYRLILLERAMLSRLYFQFLTLRINHYVLQFIIWTEPCYWMLSMMQQQRQKVSSNAMSTRHPLPFKIHSINLRSLHPVIPSL